MGRPRLARIACEELSIKVEPTNILGVYSDLNRDPRGHIMSTVFICKISDEPKGDDDAADLQWVEIEYLKNINLAFDHSKILSDYKAWLINRGTYWSWK